jgi:hypothetical protein
MLPEFYQIVLQCHLTQSQYRILNILVLLLQGQRSVQLATLARLFPQPIKYASRLRCLQRFLALSQLSLTLLWYPIIKYWLRQESKPANTDSNRASRRQLLKLSKDKYALVAIDRTQWREQNLFVASLLCKGRGIPLHWQLLPKLGNSNLSEQKRFLTATLRLLKGRSVVIIGDREFHSAKLGKWLQEKGVDFILRQKANNYLQLSHGEYQALNQQGFQVADKSFYHQICSHKMAQIGYFNLAVFWKRGYRGKKTTDPWYLLTSLSDLNLTLKLYRRVSKK